MRHAGFAPALNLLRREFDFLLPNDASILTSLKPQRLVYCACHQKGRIVARINRVSLRKQLYSARRQANMDFDFSL